MRERERERERARGRGEASDGEIAPLIAISPSRDRAVDRNLAVARSRWIEIAIDGEIAIFARSRRQSRSRSGREIAINGVARSRTGDRDQRRRDRGLEIAINDNEIAIARARSLSLSLSLSLSFFGNTLKGK